jgi:hypothetical protein
MTEWVKFGHDLGDMSTRKLKRAYFRMLRRFWRCEETRWGEWALVQQQRDHLRSQAVSELGYAKKLLDGRGVQL